MSETEVDAYVERAKLWPAEIAAIRPTLTGAGLDGTIKWGKPCYDHDGDKILILQEMKDFLAVMFFKGALMDDPEGILEWQGPNTRSARRICIRPETDVDALLATLADYVANAIAVEEAGLELGPPPELEPCQELQQRLDSDDRLRVAFESLTPGRQREYNIHISGAKQAATRERRVEKHVPKILDGLGMRE